MSNTRINARIVDQTLELTNLPLIASGSVGVMQFVCEFCELWAGYGKSAVFYREGGPIYHIPLQDGVVTVPHEVLADEGFFCFGIVGVADNTRTTEVLRVTVKQGAITSATAEPEEPTQGVYEQILSAYGRTEQDLDLQKRRLDALVALKGGYPEATYPLEDEYITLGSITTNGVTARVHFLIDGLDLSAYGSHETDGCILPALTPMFGDTIPDTITDRFTLECDNPDVIVTIIRGEEEGDWARILIINKTDQDIGIYGAEVRGEYPLQLLGLDELTDIRVGADGTIYPNAGEAVRQQVKQVDAQRFSNALKGYASGAAVTLADISPIAHPLSVKVSTAGTGSKNLFHFTDAREISADVLGLAAPNTSEFSWSADDEDGTFDRYITIKDDLSYLPAGTYTLSGSDTGGLFVVESFQLSVGDAEPDTYYELPHTFTLTEQDIASGVSLNVSWWQYFGAPAEGTIQMQIEAGEAATDYVPFGAGGVKVLKFAGKNLLDLEALANANNWLIDGSRYCSFPLYLAPNTTYTFSRKDDSTVSGIYAYFSREPHVESVGTAWFMYPNTPTHTKKVVNFTTDESGMAYINLLDSASAIQTFVELIGNAQLEVGTTATEYEPYGSESTEYTPNADGTVEGVMSDYPTTTLYTDTAGAIINVEYNRDINKAFEEIYQALATMGAAAVAIPEEV